MPNNQTKKLTHGAMMIALFTILLAIAFYVPLISVVASLFVVLPITWYSATYNRSSAIFVAIVSCIISFFLGGGILIIPLALTFAVLGVVLGDALRTKKSKLFLLISSSFAVLVTSAIQYLVSIKFFEIDIIKESINLIDESYSTSIEYTEKLTGKALISEQDLNLMFETIQAAVPALVTISVFFTTFILITVNLPILKRLGVDVPKFAPFRDMRLPRSVLWYYLIILLISLFVEPTIGSTLYVIVLNFSFVLWILFVMQGISFLFFFIHEKGLPNMLKVVVAIIAIPFYSIIMLLGILDLGFNIRGFVTGKNKK